MRQYYRLTQIKRADNTMIYTDSEYKLNVIDELQMFVNSIDLIRRQKQMSITQLCEQIGVHPNTYRNWVLTNFNSLKLEDLRRLYDLLADSNTRVITRAA